MKGRPPRRRGNYRHNQKGPGHAQKGRSGDQKRPGERRSFSSRRSTPNGQRNRFGRRQGNRFRSGHMSMEERFLREYEHFTRCHNDARRRYFEQFHRVDTQKRRALELSFFRAAEKLRDFENKMNDGQRAIVEAKKCKTYRMDTAYSDSRELTGGEESPQEFTDSMMTKEQLSRSSFQDDMQESSGTMEDYHAYRQQKLK